MVISIERAALTKILLITISILALSFFRPLLIATLPVVILIFLFLSKSRLTKSIIILLMAIGLATIFSALFSGELNIANYVLSFYFFIPIILLFLTRPYIEDDNYLQFFFKTITVILIANNLLAFVQLIKADFNDDAFIGFYGTHGLGVHTLCLVNFIVSAYYYFNFQNSKKWSKLFLSGFFLISALMSFFGLGLLVFLATIVLFRFSIRNLIKSVLVSVTVICITGFLLYFLKPATFNYNYENVRRASLFFKPYLTEQEERLIPRKFLLYRNYVKVVADNPAILIVGTGPGTFNSRTSFLLNGDYSEVGFFTSILGVHKPYYANEQVYILWNSDLVRFGMFNDGTRNEPFSAVIALLAEYGLLVFFLFFSMCYLKYKAILKHIKRDSPLKGIRIESNLLRFISIFIFLNLFTDNYLEYPEIIILFAIIIKLIEIATVKKNRDHSENGINTDLHSSLAV
jgi:hypothetical protein